MSLFPRHTTSDQCFSPASAPPGDEHSRPARVHHSTTLSCPVQFSSTVSAVVRAMSPPFAEALRPVHTLERSISLDIPHMREGHTEGGDDASASARAVALSAVSTRLTRLQRSAEDGGVAAGQAGDACGLDLALCSSRPGEQAPVL
eukprot:CAMPEP_0177668356 /NCGR_PEP_ID=MMETSP0447-20121125/22713_1 /TAXON_ID=0 /ORGANISM="Stygamoeba regulata, Strain BSH-02190019" /LENGTH=145 /DNA_ID=CAMNT_0019174849 /DNA_START=125 /DNA_END=558 /DNA_ORIENTATION=+